MHQFTMLVALHPPYGQLVPMILALIETLYLNVSKIECEYISKLTGTG